MESQKIKLPRSLRKYIREEKARIRREYGPKSDKEQELLKRAGELKGEKLKRVKK